jgi:nucleotide-binding universal stress UspA family protein
MLTINDLLVARDFSSVSDRALRHALDLAARTGATLHLLHADVLHEAETRTKERPSPSDGIDALRDQLKEAGGAAPEALDAVSLVDATRRDVSAGPAILNYAEDADVDLIAMGTHGRRGASRVLLGSVAEEVVRRARQPVLTVRGKEEDGRTPRPGAIGRLLVPVDFSDYSREALRHAREWATLYDAHVDVLHVVEEDLHPAFYVGGVSSIYDVAPDLDEKVRAKLKTFVQETLDTTEDVEAHVRVGSAPSAIVDYVEENEVDLVSLSTHGRTGMKRFFLGSVAEKVVRHVSCPVLTLKAFGKSLVASGADTTVSEA